MYINRLEVLHLKVTKIDTQYVKSDTKHIQELRDCFHKYQQIYQHVYSMLIAKVFVQNQKCGTDSQTCFMLDFKDWQD